MPLVRLGARRLPSIAACYGQPAQRRQRDLVVHRHAGRQSAQSHPPARCTRWMGPCPRHRAQTAGATASWARRVQARRVQALALAQALVQAKTLAQTKGQAQSQAQVWTQARTQAQSKA